MNATHTATIERPLTASLPRSARALTSLVRARTGQRPAATYQDQSHSPLTITEAKAEQMLAATWGWN